LQEIAIAWPSTAITPEQWRRRVEDLATQAEGMIGKQCTLQQQAQLALSWAGLCWSGFSPEVIAGSARASLLLNQSVVMATAPADQLAEISERLDAIWQQARRDPSAAVVSVAPPFVELPPAEPVKRPRRTKRALEPDLQPVENTMTDAEFEALVLGSDHGPGPAEPEPAPAPRQEPRKLRPASERMKRREPDPEPVETRVAAAPLDPEPCPPSPPPPGWLVAGEVGELLEISEATVGRWRDAGRFGEGWAKHGGRYYYSPDAVELLMAGEVPPGLDALVADVRAA
jgi:hypothetical protein